MGKDMDELIIDSKRTGLEYMPNALNRLSAGLHNTVSDFAEVFRVIDLLLNSKLSPDIKNAQNLLAGFSRNIQKSIF
jgi:hypothetical protein